MSAPHIFTEDELARFKRIIEKEKDEKWSVVMVQEDPDALGTAFPTMEVLKRFGTEPGLYSGFRDHLPQNEKIDGLFELEHVRKDLSEIPSGSRIILVDSSKIEDSRFDGTHIDPSNIRIIIDHHREAPPADDGRLILIRPWGSAAAIAVHLAEALGVELSRDAATLAEIGILSDTRRLAAPTVTDFDKLALAKLIGKTDQEKVAKSFMYDLGERYYTLLKDCLVNLTIVGPFLITRPRELLTEEESAALSLIADRFWQYETIRTAIVWGVTEKRLRACIRSKDLEKSIQPLSDDLFGNGNGGGKAGSGGATMLWKAPASPTQETAPLLIDYYTARFIESLNRRIGAKKATKESGSD